MKKSLELVYPKTLHGQWSVECTTRLDGAVLVADYKVNGFVEIDKTLPNDESCWGLWEYDVVELFVRPETSGPYYEFQVSPLNQYFEMMIRKPRVDTDPKFKSGFEHWAKWDGKSSEWTAGMRIPLEKLGWKGDSKTITGGVFACLGMNPARSYWSWYLGQQETPDYHLPDRFNVLV